ncbi:Oidioi.mRNA.OKI2018_I69.PAR.g12699.t1.cds [Oikopleura dioica]|uniref:Oidioi.mRNA.OKI2018_I69.PAR.g12699.t1.cds n=1 Tax=Oikopleura dioica TaxID=34765 RepID=A0ABN7S6Q3_OIKDI|nr:Oidioi.mRNA.OKI2018_I69.PAR.g12699.t1.cds [Oikopleura dioica]
MQEDEFALEFKKLTDISYREFENYPGIYPVYSANMDYQRRIARCSQYMTEKKAAQILRWAGNEEHNLHDATEPCHEDIHDMERFAPRPMDTDSQDTEKSSDVSFLDFDKLTENATSEKSFNRNPFLDNECCAGDDNNDYNENEAEIDENDAAQEAAERQDDAPFLEPDSSVEASLYAEYKPIRNVLSLTPNVFDDETLVRILPDRQVKELAMCKTKNCLFTHSDKQKMRKHESVCRTEPIDFIRQTVEGPGIMDHVHELVAEGFLPAFDYVQEYFLTFDIECLMQHGPYSEGVKFHRLTSVATYSSKGERQCFVRRGMEHEACEVMVTEFINYLICRQQDMARTIPQCIVDGIAHYEEKIEFENKKEGASIHDTARLRKKLKYLKDFFKLKIYSWVGERYDIVVLFPTLVSVLYHFVGGDTKLINFIKRANGYMLVEANNLSFRDFKNYTCPMSLEKLARSCGLDEKLFVKGAFPYEWYSNVKHLSEAKTMLSYPCFYSSMTLRNACFVAEMDKIIEAEIDWGNWRNDKEVLCTKISVFLKLYNITDDPSTIEHYATRSAEEGNDPYALYSEWTGTIWKLLVWSNEKRRWHFDENDAAT